MADTGEDAEWPARAEQTLSRLIQAPARNSAAGAMKGPRMIREEFNGYSESPRPASKTPNKIGPWVPLMLLVVVGLVVAHVAGLIKPLATLALEWTGLGSHAPGWRLVGNWQSDNDPMFRRVCYPTPKEGYDGTGVYRGDAGGGMSDVLFKITSEDRSGRQVEMAEYNGDNYRVRYSIADDGKSLTREYDASDGRPVSCQYRYLGPPTEEAPISYRPQ
jgi:hypothetical protein